MLVEGRAQSTIATSLGVSRKTVHKHTKALLRSGHIVLLNPGSTPQYYGPGPAFFTMQDNGGTTPPSGMVGDGLIDLHHIKLYFPVISEPQVDLDQIRWDKVWTGSGTDKHYKMSNVNVPVGPGHLVEAESIVYHRGRKASLQVNLPGCKVTYPEYVKAKRDRWNKAQDVANWFAKETQCILGLSREPEDPHRAVPPPPGISEETLRKAAEQHLRSKYVRIEASNGPLEFESDEDEWLQAYLFLPDLLNALAEADQEARGTLMVQAQQANITINSLTAITKILKGHQEQLNMLAQLVATSAPEPEEEKVEEDEPEGRYHR